MRLKRTLVVVAVFVLATAFFGVRSYRAASRNPQGGIAVGLRGTGEARSMAAATAAGRPAQAARGVPGTEGSGGIGPLPPVLRTTASRETPEPGGRGVFRRVRLVEAEFKYPLLRVVERVLRDERSGAERVLSRSVMAADHVMVRIEDGAGEAALRAACAPGGLEIRKKMLAAGMYLVGFANPDLESVPRVAAALSDRAGVVRYAEPDFLVSVSATVPNDASWGLLWGLNQANDCDIDAPEAWDLTTGSAGLVVAVIDTGLQYDHPDIASNAWVNPGEIPGNGLDDDGNGFTNDVHGWDFVSDDGDPMDVGRPR